MNEPGVSHDVAVVGGAGHVGAPLAILMAKKGLRVLVYDTDKAAVECLAGGKMPFFDEGCDEMLAQVVDSKLLSFDSDVAALAGVPVLVLTIGTLIDEFNNPIVQDLTNCIEQLMPS